MKYPIAADKGVNIRLVRLPLIIHFKKALTIKHKYPDFSGPQGLTLLNPHNLAIVIDRLHAIALYPDPKIGIFGDSISWKTQCFKEFVVKEGTCTS